MSVGASLRLPDQVHGEWNRCAFADESAEAVEQRGEMIAPQGALRRRRDISRDLACMAFFIANEFLDEAPRRPVGEMVRRLEIMPVRGKQCRFKTR